MYSIIDVETSGFGPFGNKVTEIAIVKHDGEKVIDTFHSMVNPECGIHYKVTQLTGITDQMVAHAPKFYEIAKEVLLFTQDTIFVAHNVNFDYNVIRDEYRSLGGDFNRKKLCTVRLSRKIFPGHRSYSLGNICGVLGIDIKARHRAMGDAQATAILFKMLLEKDQEGVIEQALNGRSQEGTLPPLLPKKVFEKLPQKTGVYYFHDENGKVIYVGKAKNIKKRVLSHFRDKSRKEMMMSQCTANVTWQITGNELVALLLESAEIKRLYPRYNRSQKRTNESYGMCVYEDRRGIIHLGYNHLKLISDPIVSFYNIPEARAFLERLAEEFELCPKCCHLQSTAASCFHYHIKKCKGVCCGQEDVTKYNKRVKKALKSISEMQNDFIIMEEGRKASEKAVVLVKDGIYKGFGFVSSKAIDNVDHNFESIIEPQKDNRDIQCILRQYLRNAPPGRVVYG